MHSASELTYHLENSNVNINSPEKYDVRVLLQLSNSLSNDFPALSTLKTTNEKRDIEYQYEASGPENNMLKEKLNKYCLEISGQTIDEYFEEEEVL